MNSRELRNLHYIFQVETDWYTKDWYAAGKKYQNAMDQNNSIETAKRLLKEAGIEIPEKKEKKPTTTELLQICTSQINQLLSQSEKLALMIINIGDRLAKVEHLVQVFLDDPEEEEDSDIDDVPVKKSKFN